MKEERIITVNGVETLKVGYFLSIEELQRLLRDFIVNQDFITSDRTYIENWLTNNRI
jgi:tRNA uridine 5-carbamoylmethylation protein Kti12